MFHPDPDIIDLERRIAAVFNAREIFVRQRVFWDILFEMSCPRDEKALPSAANLNFVGTTLWLLANSLTAKETTSARSIARCARKQIRRLVKHVYLERVERHLEILLLVLVRLGSETIAVMVGELSPQLVGPALSGSGGISSGKSKRARNCLSVLAFASTHFLGRRKSEVFDLGLARLQRKSNLQYSSDEAFATMDMLFPAFKESRRLREGFEVVRRDSLLQILSLMGGGEGHVGGFLEGAPGYSCSLFLLREALAADTVLLYSKSQLDDRYYLRYYQSRYATRDVESLHPAFMDSAELPSALQERMESHMFWSSPPTEKTKWLDAFCIRHVHAWALGVAAISPGDGVLHYVVAGFKELGDSQRVRNSAFFAWLCVEKSFRQLFSKIHANYSEALSSWNAVVQSIKPFHLSYGRTSEPRRRRIRRALAAINFTDIIRSSVRQTSARPGTVEDTLLFLGKNVGRIVSAVAKEAEQDGTLHSQAEKEWLARISADEEGIRLDQRSEGLRSGLFTFNRELSALIAIESLANALSYSSGDIRWGVRVYRAERVQRYSADLVFEFWMSNESNKDLVIASKARRGRGIEGCKMAALASGGSFELVNDGGVRTAILKLPAWKVPDELLKGRDYATL